MKHYLALVIFALGTIATQAAFAPVTRDLSSISESMSEVITCNAISTRANPINQIKKKTSNSFGIFGFKVAVDPRNRMLKTRIKFIHLVELYGKSAPAAALSHDDYLTQMYDPTMVRKNLEEVDFRLAKLDAKQAQYYTDGSSLDLSQVKAWTMRVWIHHAKNENPRDAKKIPHKTYAELHGPQGESAKFACTSRGF